MRILFTTQALTIGGIEVLALRFSEAFGAAGHEVTLYDFSPQRRVESFVAQFDQSKFKLAGFRPRPWLNRLFWKFNALLVKSRLRPGGIWEQVVERHFARLLATQDFDIICSLSFHQDYLACKYANGKPVVISMHGVYEYAAPEWPDKAAFIYKHAKAISYLAEKNMDYYRQQSYFRKSMPLSKIYNGTELNKSIEKKISKPQLCIPEDNFVYILVARGVREKGWQEAIEAFINLREKYSKVSLLLVGEGEFLDQLKSTYTNELGVLFYGLHLNPIELIALADVGLLPTYFPIESLPNVIVDYLTCGLPVISTVIGEIPDMLQTADWQLAGTVLPLLPEQAGVSVTLLTEAMECYLTDAAYYAEQAARVQEVRRKFDIHTCVRRYTELFEQVLAAPGS